MLNKRYSTLHTIDDILKIYPNILEVMRKAALTAGEKIIREYQRQKTTVIKKEDNSPLTNADRIANEFIVKQLKSNFQNILVISEEGENNRVEDLEDFFFLVDPLDGTKEFLKKTGEFTVNIGLICKKKPSWVWYMYLSKTNYI